ncbi:hypothetical protein KKG58_00965 [Patescibacteria group bacterium]|nr:hypothetical protein [Patescibacteria group bacterium]
MSILKSICLIFFILILAALEFSSPLIPAEVSLIFILTILFLIKSGKDKIIKHILLISICGGILLDVYSIFSPGLFILSLILTIYFCYKFLLCKFDLNKSLSIFVFGLAAVLVYQVFILLISQFFYLINLSDLRISFDKFYWFALFQSIILNALLITAFSFVVRLCKNWKSDCRFLDNFTF